MLLLRALLFSLFVTSILAIPVTSGTTGVDKSSVGSRLKATVNNLFPGTSNRINGYWHNKVKVSETPLVLSHPVLNLDSLVCVKK